jgi:phosphoribosylaminoimidazolecarboxamide formyltransferase / IMP cyclohydrolase
MKTQPHIRRALLSVSDKTGIVELAKQLVARNIQLISTGGTANLLRSAQIPVTEVSDYTQFPELMDGRIKTLHPRIFAGLLNRGEQDAELMQTHQLEPIDLVVVNLYPFMEVIADPHCSFERAIENIDIGGPSMLRAAAKNFAHVSVLCDPADYPQFLAELATNHGQVSQATRAKFAQKVFAHTHRYDAAIDAYLSGLPADHTELLPETLQIHYQKQQTLRYGENAHQASALYIDAQANPTSLAASQPLQGKPCSFNNFVDADTAWACVNGFSQQPTCVIVKHANPCGIAVAESAHSAYLRAYATDPVSAFGGIIAFNTPVDGQTAQTILAQQFTEVIIAPAFTDEAKQLFQSKPNLRLLCCQPQGNAAPPRLDYKRIDGGLLVQECDRHQIHASDIKIVSQTPATPEQLQDLLFAWHAVKYVKSNAIVYAKQLATLGIGAGQMSRVFSAQIAVLKAQQANLNIAGSVMASDAFLPFADTVEMAAEQQVAAIIQPGGSMRDHEVIQAADKAGIVLAFTGVRHFRH